MSQNFKFVQNKVCEYFPCHAVKNESEFNCLFCFCPLYLLKEDCGGNFEYLESGVKDCSGCAIPHLSGGYDFVMKKMELVIERARIGE